MKKEKLIKQIDELKLKVVELEKEIENIDKEEFVTVTDGFRGSLELKECWVRDHEDNEWELIENAELLCRENDRNYPYILLNSGKSNCLRKYLKFHPFSPENPPPVDWLCEVWDEGSNTKRKRYFKYYHEDGSRAITYTDGSTSQSGDTGTAWNHHKFLNIESVEE